MWHSQSIQTVKLKKNTIKDQNFKNSIINNPNARKKSNDELSDGICSHSYMNSMNIPVICDRVVPG